MPIKVKPMSSPLRKRPTKAQNDTNAFVIVGGGIAGVSCAQELAQLCPSAQVTIISESNTVVEVNSSIILTPQSFISMRNGL